MERLGLGPDVCLAAQSAPRLRPHDRLGPGRPARAGGGTRHQLHRARRRARRDRPRRRSRRCRRSTWSATSAAAACCSRSAWRARWSRRARSGAGPGRRRRDGRRRRAADGDDLRHARPAAVERRARHQPARRPARTSTTPTRCADGKYIVDRLDRAAVLCRAAREAGARRTRTSRARWTSAQWPALKRPARRDLQDQDARRVVRAAWRAPTSASRRCSTLDEAPQHPHNRGARHLHRGRRRDAAGARAALQPHRAQKCAMRRGVPRNAWTTYWKDGSAVPAEATLNHACASTLPCDTQCSVRMARAFICLKTLKQEIDDV